MNEGLQGAGHLVTAINHSLPTSKSEANSPSLRRSKVAGGLLGRQKPNFFILGAPKCGTTSMAEWLRCHPNIFMSPEKEPYFFNTDDGPSLYTLDRYEDLFRGADEQHIAVGEASTFYLSSSKAVTNIIRYQPRARFIVMVRSPVEMAQSYHAEMVIRGAEGVQDFFTAWSLQEDRRLGLYLPAFSATKRHFLYGELCALGAQLERLLTIVPRDRVLVIVLDDLASNPRAEYLRVLEFLGVPDDGRLQFPVCNSARASRWPKLRRWIYLFLQAKHRLGITRGSGAASWVLAATQIEQPLPPLPSDKAAKLSEHFADDVERLGELLGRDLQHWLTCAAVQRSKDRGLTEGALTT
jgi:hypothetical protein